MSPTLCAVLTLLSTRYETAAFLRDDPSQFMHRYAAPADQERAAFLAACLSYGSRAQFLPKIDTLLYTYLHAQSRLPDDDHCFYRLHTHRMVNRLLAALDTLYADYGTMHALLAAHAIHTGSDALRLLVDYFSPYDVASLVPRSTLSACKRLCMFLRWMVRDGSPVDLGLWSDIIDKRTLIMPLDTHVLHEAQRLGLLTTRAATMATALRLTEKLRCCFPDDPLRGDFALFGVGVDTLASSILSPAE